MPESTAMMRAWRTDSGEGPATATVACPASPMRSPGERRPADAGDASSMPRETGVSRLGAALARAGRGAWERAFGRRDAGFEEVLHGYAAELATARSPEAIEAALRRLAQDRKSTRL